MLVANDGGGRADQGREDSGEKKTLTTCVCVVESGYDGHHNHSYNHIHHHQYHHHHHDHHYYHDRRSMWREWLRC